MKRKKWLFIVGGVIVLAVFVVLALKSSAVKKIDVTVERASRGELTSVVTATGKVKAQADVEISADVMGRIEQMPVKEGNIVKSGQLLLQIDSRSREMDVAQVRGALQSAQSALETARITLDRERQLFEKKLSSQAQLDIAQNTYDQAQAQVQINQATLDRALDQLEKTTIRAPMSGIITKLNSEVGENVVIGTMNAPGTVIMTISDLSAIEIEAEVDETDIAAVKLGQDVKISLDAFPDTTFKGSVIEVGNSAKTSISSGLSASDQVTNFLVKVLILDTIPNIKPGMTASVDITTAYRDDVVKIPSGSVVMRPEGTEKEDITRKAGGRKSEANAVESAAEGQLSKKDKKDVDGVFVVKQGRALFAPVQSGIRDQQYVEITNGLADGDSVIIGPYRTLRTIKHGDHINPQKPKFGPDADSVGVRID
jgi:HlyD family secretion protein